MLLGVVVVGLGAGLFMLARGRHTAAPTPAATHAPALPTTRVEQSLRDTLAQRPRDPVAHDALGRYLLEEHRPFEALWQFRAAQDLTPADPRPTIAATRALAQAGLPEHALSLVRHLPPRSAEARLVVAEIALATARPADARAALAGAAVTASAPAQQLLGDADLAAEDVAGARAAYRRVIALEPDSAAGYDRLGRLELAASQFQAAQKACAAARERQPRNPGHLYRLGLACAAAGEGTTAERLWQQVAETSPRYAPARAELGKLARSRKEWSTSAAHLVAAVQSDPASEDAQRALADVMTAQEDRASAFYQRGFFDLQTDRPHLALTEFRRMMEVTPERVDGPLMASLAYIQMQRLDRAAVEAQRGLERHPGETRLLARLAQLHTISRNRPKAKRLCEEWLKIEPGAAEPTALLARIAREEGQLPEALRYGEQALAREPESATVCFEMSKTLSALPGPENRRRALDLARQAAYRNPREAEHWHQLGVLLRGEGQPEEAADALLRSLDRSIDSVPSCGLLVQIAAQEQRPETSRFFATLVTEREQRNRTSKPLWRAVYRDPEDAAAHARLARYLLATGELRRARYQLQQVIALRPTDAAARRDLAVVDRLLALQEP